jgi:hypothetical protein
MTDIGCGRSSHRSSSVTQLKYPADSDGSRLGLKSWHLKPLCLEHCMLVVEGLTCRFGKKAAVDNASFSIAPGDAAADDQPSR